MENITIKDLTKGQREDLKRQLEEYEEVWPQNGDTYFYTDNFGCVRSGFYEKERWPCRERINTNNI